MTSDVSVIFPERRREQGPRGGFGDRPRPHLDHQALTPAAVEQSDLFNGRNPSHRLSRLFLSPAFLRALTHLNAPQLRPKTVM